jgi:hypothetical protein
VGYELETGRQLSRLVVSADAEHPVGQLGNLCPVRVQRRRIEQDGGLPGGLPEGLGQYSTYTWHPRKASGHAPLLGKCSILLPNGSSEVRTKKFDLGS